MDRAASDDLGFKKMLGQHGEAQRRIDIFPQLVDVGYYQLQKLFDAKTVELFTHHPTPFGTHKDQLLLSKKHERNRQLIKIFNRGLQRLKESGRYEQYFEESRRGEYLK